MPKKTKTKVLWLTNEPREYWGQIAQNASRAGIDLWIFNDAAVGKHMLGSLGCRRPNGFRAVVFDLTIGYATEFCKTVRRKYPGLPRICFTPHSKDARKQIPTFDGQTSTRPTLIQTWYQGDEWANRPRRFPEDVTRSSQLTHILQEIIGI